MYEHYSCRRSLSIYYTQSPARKRKEAKVKKRNNHDWGDKPFQSTQLTFQIGACDLRYYFLWLWYWRWRMWHPFRKGWRVIARGRNDHRRLKDQRDLEEVMIAVVVVVVVVVARGPTSMQTVFYEQFGCQGPFIDAKTGGDGLASLGPPIRLFKLI